MNADARDQIAIEIVYATPDEQVLIETSVPDGTRVGEALAASTLADRFPGTDFGAAAVGIWGHVVSRDRRLVAGDRIEVYRPLLVDPREARRRRATD